ncbi:Putative membrane protein [Amycolatopsis japonica]|uniref:Putative membrane protein n=1 Tax=Amycolatopsis japonica TaxID=208439 RepID=A0A075V557_9PSEU|nr:Putative membrane protein [Amycolatopsis japonica]
MAAVALLVYLTYLGLAFGMRSWQQYRCTGDVGFRGVSGRPGSLEWWGGALFAVAVVLGLVAPALQLASVVGPWAVLDAAGVHVLGLLLTLAGVVGTLAAQQSMGTSWRIGRRSNRSDPSGHQRRVPLGPQPSVHRDDRRRAGNHAAGTEPGCLRRFSRAGRGDRDPGPRRGGALPTDGPWLRLSRLRVANRQVPAGIGASGLSGSGWVTGDRCPMRP